ncbi:ParA family protein [Bacillus cereus group sp. Bc015]|uniref:ParA family protein n=1 Tax=Bacillus cereus group sp. Bc015 TaxID=3018123 RepID=UPI0022E946B2|nr:ParA family protein [Bacillus cereus group sp. Bc015]MDA2738409.1 ParA family protein [Bacillus cereus group sp. Bc015]
MKAKVICINNNKGGVLKTTTTTNLAGVLANKGYKVLIIDADNQANVPLAFGLMPEDFRLSIYDVLTGGVPAEECIVTVKNHPNIDILPSNRELVSFEFKVIGDKNKFPEPFYLMVDNLDHLKDQYDYILIDTPPSLGVMNGNVFTYSDYVIIPFAPELFSMRSLVEVVRTIREFKDIHNPPLEILGVLRTLVEFRSNAHSDVIQETNKYASQNDIHIFDTVIPKTVQFTNSVLYNQVPASLLPKKKRDKAGLYYDLWNELEGYLEGGKQ